MNADAQSAQKSAREDLAKEKMRDKRGKRQDNGEGQKKADGLCNIHKMQKYKNYCKNMSKKGLPNYKSVV